MTRSGLSKMLRPALVYSMTIALPLASMTAKCIGAGWLWSSGMGIATTVILGSAARTSSTVEYCDSMKAASCMLDSALPAFAGSYG
jgi:hypothetical protein